MLRFAIVCVLVGLSVQAAVDQKAAQGVSKKFDWTDWEKPAFCRGNDCPVYDMVEATTGYELRTYKAGQWVSTTGEGIDWETGNEGLFMKLFYYIEGENESGQKIEMTSPVLTKVVPGSGPNCKSTFTRSFYIEWSSQGEAPKPTRSDVFLETKPEMKVYTKAFSGYATSEQHVTNVMELGTAVGDETMFHTGFWYAVGYDSPFQPFGRRNEGWLIATY